MSGMGAFVSECETTNVVPRENGRAHYVPTTVDTDGQWAVVAVNGKRR